MQRTTINSKIKSWIRRCKKIDHLDANGKHLGDNGVLALIDIVAANVMRRLVSISLRSNCIGARSGVALATHMMRNTHALVCLDLSDNSLGDAAVEQVALAMKYAQGLRALFLDSTQCGVLGATALSRLVKAHGCIRSLSLNENFLCDESLKRIGSSLAHHKCTLEELSMLNNMYTECGVRELLLFVARNTSLLHLNLNTTPGQRPLKAVFKERDEQTSNSLFNNTSLLNCAIISSKLQFRNRAIMSAIQDLWVISRHLMLAIPFHGEPQHRYQRALWAVSKSAGREFIVSVAIRLWIEQQANTVYQSAGGGSDSFRLDLSVIGDAERNRICAPALARSYTANASKPTLLYRLKNGTELARRCLHRLRNELPFNGLDITEYRRATY